MTPCLGLFILAAAALAGEPALPHLTVLQWQVEAQARQRSLTRRLGDLEKVHAQEPKLRVELPGTRSPPAIETQSDNLR